MLSSGNYKPSSVNTSHLIKRKRTDKQRWARATFFWVRNRNSATWRKNFRNRNSAKEKLLCNPTSAILQSQFFLISATWELYLRNFQHIFGRGIRSGFMKKIWDKNHVQLSLWGKFLVSRETDSYKIFGWFLKPSWAEENVPESSGIGRRLQRDAEVKFWRSAIAFRNSVPQLF